MLPGQLPLAGHGPGVANCAKDGQDPGSAIAGRVSRTCARPALRL